MDRVFVGTEPPPPALPAAAPPPTPRRRRLVMGLGLGLLVGGMVHLWQNQQRVQLDLQQERQWRMLERLRTMETPAAPLASDPAPAPVPDTVTLTPQPPPPPPRAPVAPTAKPRAHPPRHREPIRRIGPPPIRVPLPPPAPPRLPPPPVQAPLPDLLGVVQTAGQRDSAIFSTAAGPLSVTAGEGIGSTGWRLLAVTADGVEIGRGNERRSLSLGR